MDLNSDPAEQLVRLLRHWLVFVPDLYSPLAQALQAVSSFVFSELDPALNSDPGPHDARFDLHVPAVPELELRPQIFHPGSVTDPSLSHLSLVSPDSFRP